MEFVRHSHRFAREITEQVKPLGDLWDELSGAISSISEDDLISHFKENFEGNSKSISLSINALLKERLVGMGWDDESRLFADSEYRRGGRWRLDFSKATEIPDLSTGDISKLQKSGIAVEVAFNHGEAIAWNLLKPAIAAELNHVPQETQIGAGLGVIICATSSMKKAGAFDSAVGEYEKFLQYLRPMRNFLTTPLIIVGLQPPETFKIRLEKKGNKNIGFIQLV